MHHPLDNIDNFSNDGDDYTNESINDIFTEKQFECCICFKEFKSLKILYKHMLIHQKTDENGKVYFNCNKCDKKFSQVRKFIQHNDFVHKGMKKCHKCKTLFPNKETLKMHMDSIHDGGYKCDQCDKKFSQMKNLNFHKVNVHENEDLKPFKCEKCDKSFGRANTLKEHVLYVHEKFKSEGSYKCDQCDKKYPTRSSLNRHFTTVHEGRDEYF